MRAVVISSITSLVVLMVYLPYSVLRTNYIAICYLREIHRSGLTAGRNRALCSIPAHEQDRRIVVGGLEVVADSYRQIPARATESVVSRVQRNLLVSLLSSQP